MGNFIKYWVVPVVISGLIFTVIQPVLAQAVLPDTASADIVVSSQSGSNDFRQIYYESDGQQRYITDSNYTNANPDQDGEYITWMAQIGSGWQVFLYHVPSETTTQLSYYLNNANPKISDGKVVWEGWVDDRWQIFFFDGVRVRQLTKGDLALNPDIEDGAIVFGRRDASGQWRAERYNISDGRIEEVGRGLEAKFPFLSGGRVILGRGETQEVETAVAVETFTPEPEPESPLPELSVSPEPSFFPSPETSLEPSPSLLPGDPEVVNEEDIRKELDEAALPTPRPSVSPTPNPSPSSSPNLEPSPSPTPEAM